MAAVGSHSFSFYSLGLNDRNTLKGTYFCILSASISGIISIGDLVKAVIADQKEEIEQLEHYISG
jgi:hypothetical protein